MEKEGKQPKNKSILNQNIIGWQHFYRGRVSKHLTTAMETYYTQHPDNPNFTEKGWIKQMIALMLIIHIEEWYLRFHILTSSENIDDDRLSPEKRSLLLTIQLFCEKIGSLSVSKQKWFNHSEEEYQKKPVQSLKQWIKIRNVCLKYITKNRRKERLRNSSKIMIDP